MTKKNLGDTVLGWFVVREGDDDESEGAKEDHDDERGLESEAAEAPPRPRVAPQTTRKPPPPVPDAHAPPSLRLAGTLPPVAAGAPTDARVFEQVFQSAQISSEAQGRVDRTLSLLQSLPGETPKETRKQIVEASLRAFGIPIDAIIETAAEEIQALEAYIQHAERQTQSVLIDANTQIDKLSSQIAEIKKLMELQLKTQQGVVKASNEQKLRVQTVLEFFGQEAVARVVEQSPKLVAPK